ncbi:YhcH/YjgK/YiaL family protein [Kaistella daneshvariae]|uniref:YhcH/YjgK/YiaL family protein n=1 Tax=Kaistella daneshvariae TaxID=2487074 RepID=UPI001FD40E64|nr:YhcH/YjgK/YiaL family protein [Kaistella daneshvariae]
MIIDTLKNADKYTSLHPLFAKAFEYLRENNLENLPDGTVEISHGLKAIISNKPGNPSKQVWKNLNAISKILIFRFA